MFQDFLTFLVATGLATSQVTTLILLFHGILVKIIFLKQTLQTVSQLSGLVLYCTRCKHIPLQVNNSPYFSGHLENYQKLY